MHCKCNVGCSSEKAKNRSIFSEVTKLWILVTDLFYRPPVFLATTHLNSETSATQTTGFVVQRCYKKIWNFLRCLCMQFGRRIFIFSRFLVLISFFSLFLSFAFLFSNTFCCRFLPLARYVSNVAKRSTWQQCTYWGPTTDRPTTDLAFWKISNGHISATGHPIHFMFGSMVGFSRSADRRALFPVGPNPRWQPSAVLYNFEWPYLWNVHPVQFIYGSKVNV